jgi:hypothetical protein
MKKRWLIGIVSFPVFLLVGFGVPHAIKSLNRDKLIVLNSNLAKLSEADLASRIPLEPAPRTLLLGEIERIRDLLDPGNRHLVKNAQGQYFSLELQFRPPEGKKLLVATAGNAEKAKE